MRTVWLVGIAFGGLGFVFALLEKEIRLRDDLDTKFGIEEEKGKRSGRTEEPLTA